MNRLVLRPAEVCRALLAALEASEARRRSRKRDQTPAAIGLAAKRSLLQSAVLEDPEPSHFEAWLRDYVAEARDGTALAMARAVRDEWLRAHTERSFAAWLASGAPSDAAHVPNAIRRTKDTES